MSSRRWLAQLLGVAVAGALVAAPAAARGRRDAPARASVSAASVTTTVVGPRGPLFGPRIVGAAATAVAVAGKRCLIAANTPLAALSAAYGVGGPAFRLHDYGSCSRNPADAGQLFVTQIGAFPNRGINGWEYEVDGRAGTTGAANTSGPFGNGRLLRPGDRLLWFWCTMTASGSCRR